MITVLCKGGLGNILFQYAAGRAVAVRTGASLCLDLGCYGHRRTPGIQDLLRELACFRLEAELFVPSRLRKLVARLDKWRPGNGIYREAGFGYDPAVTKLGDGVRLDGYFQSQKYFGDIERQIRRELQFRKPFSGGSISAIEKMIRDTNSVAVHVRRGDYLKLPLHNVCNENYYSRSVEYFRDAHCEPRFFVFSDDIRWCSSNMKGAEFTFVDINVPDQRLVEFQLMSSCRHNIISNSSFSWWAAWLNASPGKVVVSPNRWFNDRVMNEQALEHTIPDSWIRMKFQ